MYYRCDAKLVYYFHHEKVIYFQMMNMINLLSDYESKLLSDSLQKLLSDYENN